ncbi:hypothetical protein ACU5AX_00355 [Sphingomonas sp. XXL09]|uniref:hypothetical protein n=1 Tax=Sphingomonas sp. XXL09 TaxID=3457787 RepID=UPI00406BAB46
MRVLGGLIPLLLGVAAPVTSVPPETFWTWGTHPVVPLALTAGGLTVTVTATPCRERMQNEGCNNEGVSNQARITVTQPGLPPFDMISDRQASYVRVAIVRLSRSGRAGVVVDNQWGGSAGITAVTVVEPTAGGFRAVPLTHQGSAELIGKVRLVPLGRRQQGWPGFVLEAPGFNFSEECNACGRGIPMVLTLRQGRSVDISADPAVRRLFARDLPARRRLCLSTETERNGECAAFVADAARLGRVSAAWRVMLAHYSRHTPDFPARLRAFLVNDGYVDPATAQTLPLAQPHGTAAEPSRGPGAH